MPGLLLMQELCINVDDHLSLRLPLLAEEVHLLPQKIREHWTLMVIPLPVRPLAIDIITGALGG